MKKIFLLLTIVSLFLFAGCYEADDPTATDEPTAGPTIDPTPEPTDIPWSNETKLIAVDGVVSDDFGRAVSISGDYAIVGVSGEMGIGAAFIYTKTGTIWSVQQKIFASAGDTGQSFGYSVGISGDYIIVGAVNVASAYIFARSGTIWTEQPLIKTGDSAYLFGKSVGISGDYAIVGANGDDNGHDLGTGSAYIFHREEAAWNEQQNIIASDEAVGDQAGFSVGISGDYAIMGAPYNDDSGLDSGSAYIFVRAGTIWNEQEKLVANDAASEDYFGIAVAISGDYAVVGATGNEDLATDTGAAYVFVREGTNWTQQQKLTASDAVSNDKFGNSVSISGDTIVVGTKADDSGRGSAYIFVRDGTTWTQQSKLTASDRAEGDNFGCSVGISGSSAIIGAYNNNEIDVSNGAVYIYE
ncbi:MAG: FG-GAP repeat protein [Spirochaetales bacterium]|nr:FG-GAP repeat protein [Spirochaetales bacterium]